jgi:hypothetical protein
MEYEDFIDNKRHISGFHGFEPIYLPDCLFDFQQSLTSWAIKKGRAAIFADCGMGKTLMQLVWADNVVRKTNKPVLIVTPLAVGYQTAEEAEKFGIDASRSSDGKANGAKVFITNYERLHHFDKSAFSGMVCDESSILKNFEGATKAAITEFMRMMKYRLLCTATAAPNDYVELGTSSEALGELGYMDMLGMFFTNKEGSLHPNSRAFATGRAFDGLWRFKSHAEQPFWRWMCSWARALRRPSDLGFDDRNFVLPGLVEEKILIEASKPAPGMLFVIPAKGLAEQRKEKKQTIVERCEKAAELVEGKDYSVSWCHLNQEGDLLEKMIADSVQVSGNDSDDEKEEKFIAFSSGQVKRLITKPKIAAFGMNWQHCNHMTYFPSHSFEQYYQCVRRFWRFGQKRSVLVDTVTTEGEADVFENLKRKAKACELMFESLVAEMNNELAISKEITFGMNVMKPSFFSGEYCGQSA